MTDDTLLDVIDRLTIEHPHQISIEGRKRWVRRDPLIQQLREAIASTLTGGNGLAASQSRIPFDDDAHEQYNELETLTIEQLRPLGVIPHLTPEQNLRTWYARFIGTATVEEQDAAYETWSGWEHRIETKLTAPIVLELISATTKRPYPCPDCGFEWFEQITNKGGTPGTKSRWHEKEKRVALIATYRPDGEGGLKRSAVECGCCGWRVSGPHGVRGFAWGLEKADGQHAEGTTPL